MKKASFAWLLLIAAVVLGSISHPEAHARSPRQVSQVEDGTLKNIQGAAKMDGDKMTFVTDDDGRVWNVVNPEVLKGQLGQHVELNVHLYPSKGSIHVHTVKKIKK
jgi:hypothetical protein